MSKAWHEKEASFEDAYVAGRTAKNLWRYIPRNIYHGVDDCVVDPDGYWIYLAPGWTAYDHGEDCRIIHEFTIRDLQEAIKTIRQDYIVLKGG